MTAPAINPADVRDWHERMQLDGMLERPVVPSHESRVLGQSLVDEEYGEMRDAVFWASICEAEGPDLCEPLAAVAKEGIDLIFVVIGALLRHGIPVGECWDEVVRSNNSKTPGIKSDSGKLQKGPAYSPPDLVSIIRRAREEA